MNAKLTLRLDEDLIKAARRCAARNGKSVSKRVENCFAVLPEAVDTPAAATVVEVEITPCMKTLYSVLARAHSESINPMDARPQHLDEKQR